VIGDFAFASAGHTRRGERANFARVSRSAAFNFGFALLSILLLTLGFTFPKSKASAITTSRNP
jgi:hypothetical protein